MKPVLHKLARVGLALVLLYGTVLALSLLLVPRASADEPIDTARAARSLYLTEPKYVFLARERLQGEEPKLLLLGASNTMAGFKPHELQPLLPRIQVHNLAVGGSNITELSQVAELVRDLQSPEARGRTHYVLGLWYGMFASDAARWHTADRVAGDTDIDIERYRYGFYRRSQRGPVPLLPPAALGVGVTLIHPYLVLDKLARDLTSSLRLGLSGKAPALSDQARNAHEVTLAEQQQHLEFWRRYMGSLERLPDEQFERLRALVKLISNDGGSVLLVDMPIPEWHARGSDLARQYRERMQRLTPELTALPGVALVAMESEDTDSDFSDEVHPKPRVTPRWSARLAAAVNSSPLGISAAESPRSNDHG